jgi:drug/metabolite transporter (DMT)-like permease
MLLVVLLTAVLWGLLPVTLRYVVNRGAKPSVIMFVVSFTFFAATCIYAVSQAAGGIVNSFSTGVRETPVDVLLVLICSTLIAVFGANLMYVTFLSTDLQAAMAVLTISSLVSLSIITYDAKSEFGFRELGGIALIVVGVAALVKTSESTG